MTTKELSSKLSRVSGFFAVFEGVFVWGRARSAYRLYNKMPHRGVADLHLLRSIQCDDTTYFVYVFDCHEHLTPKRLKPLFEMARTLDDDTLCTISKPYDKLMRAQNLFENWESGPVCIVMPDKNLCTHVIFAQGETDTYLYPLTGRQVELLAKS